MQALKLGMSEKDASIAQIQSEHEQDLLKLQQEHQNLLLEQDRSHREALESQRKELDDHKIRIGKFNSFKFRLESQSDSG